MSDSEKETNVMEGGRPVPNMALETGSLGLRLRSVCGSSHGGGVPPLASSPSLQPMTEDNGKTGSFMYGDPTSLTIKKTSSQGGSSDSGSPDSGYHGVDELSCLDNDISCECFPSNIAETSISSECFPSPRFAYSKSDILLTGNEGTAGTVLKADGGKPWNIHFLSSLVLLVLFGACGFGLLLTSRHLESPDLSLTRSLGGKYRAMQFARERILEEERLAEEVTRIMAGEEDSEDPDDPQFRPVAPQVGPTGSRKNKKEELVAAAVHRMKRQVDEETSRLQYKREVGEDTPANFRLVGQDEAYLV